MPRTVLNCATWITIFGLGSLALPGHCGEPSIVQTPKDKESYAIGVDMARTMKGRRVQVEIEPLLQGMRDALTGAELKMTDEDLRKTLRAWQDERRGTPAPTTIAGPAGVAQENLAKGAAFLAQNKTNAGVVTLPSGLQYKILKAGSGPKPKATDTVECHHRSTFIDGIENTSTYRVGAPATIKINSAIAAWKEALPLMSVGSKWQLFIPPQLAYGEKGVVDARGRTKIAPNTTLICEMELVGIK
jgi:UDP-GlcNAc:undecaprenyl-phosphate/decaprenyl-phosphate GlcNAc-1-phosphate transferase